MSAIFKNCRRPRHWQIGGKSGKMPFF